MSISVSPVQQFPNGGGGRWVATYSKRTLDVIGGTVVRVGAEAIALDHRKRFGDVDRSSEGESAECEQEKDGNIDIHGR